jgi:hypothetical protein
VESGAGGHRQIAATDWATTDLAEQLYFVVHIGVEFQAIDRGTVIAIRF